MNKFAAFAGGLLFGTAGLKILSSRDAKKVTYTPRRLFCAPRTA